MDDEIFDRIKDLISETQGIDPDRINRATRIELDLGIYGDDAVELLMTYSKRFDVDVSNFMAADYFSGEGLDIGAFFCSLFKAEIHNKKELRIADLEKGVIA